MNDEEKDAVTSKVKEKWQKEVETMNASVFNALPPHTSKNFFLDEWYPMCYQMFPGYVTQAKKTLSQSSQLLSEESLSSEGNLQLQQILAADIKVPQALNHAFCLFALVSSHCDTFAETQAYLTIQKRIAIEQSDFMKQIVQLVEHWNLDWEYLCSHENHFCRPHLSMLWREWIMLIKLKHTQVNELPGANKRLKTGFFDYSLAPSSLLSAGALLPHESLPSFTQSQQDISASSVPMTTELSGVEALMEAGLCVSSNIELKPCVWLSSDAVLKNECDGTAWQFQGMLLDFDDQPRTYNASISGSPRRGLSETDSSVRNLLCVDRTGPAVITLWGKSCEDFQRALQSTVSMSPPGSKWYVTVERVRVQPLGTSATNGNILTPMKSMHSIVASSAQETSIAITSTAVSPFLRDHAYVAPMPPYCIDNYQNARTQFVLPFRATIRGTVNDVTTGDFTNTGLPKTSFALVDSLGAWLHCSATGHRNAGSKALVDGTEIIAYNVNARPHAAPGKPPCVWLFKDSTIIRVGTSTVQKRVKIDLVPPPP